MSKKRKREDEQLDLVVAPPKTFPVELVEKILLSLPANKWRMRSLGISKSYKNRLSEPDFLRDFLFQNSDFYNDSQLVIQRQSNDRTLHSFHSGIFCLCNGNAGGDISTIALWNPNTAQTKVLPDSILTDSVKPYGLSLESIGFGFDPNSNDYKVLRCMSCIDDDEIGGEYEHFLELYSLRMNSWRLLDMDGYHCPYNIPYSVPSNDGRWFHWCCEDFELARFDMSSEDYDWYGFVSPVMMDPSPMISFSMVKGLLVVMFIKEDSLETWISVDYEKRMLQLSSVKLNQLDACPVNIWKDGRGFLQRSGDGKLVVIDLLSGNIIPTELQIEGDWTSFKLFPYTPSPVSLA
ncbi:unnamed protein product [Linum tenue]|uniref:F-box associated beta-propeller type 1 domain-containing protein n=1 Tax=Linum tenue TaxID=586396 RepID=A0AAV0IB06_9ROSI|nr:unnamed protein product [Linum tenue]